MQHEDKASSLLEKFQPVQLIKKCIQHSCIIKLSLFRSTLPYFLFLGHFLGVLDRDYKMN